MSTRNRHPDDFRDEVAAHIEHEAERLVAEGMAREDAWTAARRRFGNTTTARERFHEARRWMFFDTLARDLRHSFRSLRHSRTFTVVAILSLALGIGANTAVFSLVDAVLLKTLPVRNPEELRIVTFVRTQDSPLQSHSGYTDRSTGRNLNSSFSYPGFLAMQQQAHEFDALIGFSGGGVAITVAESTSAGNSQFVSGNFFSALGVQAIRGRVLQSEDDRSDASVAAVITYHFWERRLGLDPGVVGQPIFVNRIPATIVGVLPSGFNGPEMGAAKDIFIPLASVPQMLAGSSLTTNDSWWVQVLGRLRSGVRAEAAATSAHAALAAQIESYAPGRPAPEIVLNPGAYGVTGFVRAFILPSVWGLVAFASLILLICCVNLANLLFGRGASRLREIAVRMSIGASRWNVVRHLLTESIVISVSGGLLGVLISQPLLAVLMRFLAGPVPLSLDARIDSRALLFTFAVSVATAILFGTMPAWRATKVDLTPALKDGGTGGRLTSRAPVSRVLVVTQVALSMLLLIGASLLTRTFVQLATTDLGFQTDHLLTFRVSPQQSGYQGQRVLDTYAEMRRQIEALPGVTSVGLSHEGLIQGGSTNGDTYIPGATHNPSEHMRTWFLYCSDSFLQTMNIPLLTGRHLAASDVATGEKVAVVNGAFVRLHFQDVNPVGQIFYDQGAPYGVLPRTPPIRIVGVVHDAKYTGVRAAIPPTAYLPYIQQERARDMTFVVRTPLDPASIAGSVRNTVTQMDRTIPVIDMRTQEEQISLSLGREQTIAALSGGFGLLAAVLAAIGLYGVMAYTVTRRTPEFGIRLALGATRSNVQWLTLRGSVWMIAAGLTVGTAAGLALTKFLSSLLYGVEPTDAPSFAIAAIVILASGGMAAWLPARHASNVDPLMALRHE